MKRGVGDFLDFVEDEKGFTGKNSFPRVEFKADEDTVHVEIREKSSFICRLPSKLI